MRVHTSISPRIAVWRGMLAHSYGRLQAVARISSPTIHRLTTIAIPRVEQNQQDKQGKQDEPSDSDEAAVSRIQRVRRFVSRHWSMEAWVALLASVASVVSYSYYVQQGLTLAYTDAISHLMIARRVFSASTPGLAQLGTAWLPLNHILMLPLVWNETLFRDGFAGSLPSMLAYVVSAVYMYRLALLLFSSKVAGWAAALALMLNPSMLYMQSTPMSELDLICFAVIAIYYAIRWVRGFSANDLVKCALATMAGTLVRYDGWALALTLLVVVVLVAWRLRGRLIAESHGLLFGTLGLAGCAAWIIYQVTIFKSPFDFLYGPYAAHTQQQTAKSAGDLPTDHNLLLSLNVYAHATLDTLTWPIVIAALLGLVVFIYRTRLRITSWSVFVVLVPFAFNWLSLFLGMTTLETPDVPAGGVVTYFNVRYGMMMIPAAALFIAALAAALASLRRELAPIVLVVIILASTPIVAGAIPYALQDPLHGAIMLGRLESHQEGFWLAHHYHGGRALVSTSPFSAMIFDSGLPERTFISDGDGSLFRAALAHPENTVNWVFMTPAGGNFDPVWAALHKRTDWRRHFALRKVFGATQIYERIPTAQAATISPLAIYTSSARRNLGDRTRPVSSWLVVPSHVW